MERAQQLLTETFGFDQFLPGQAEVIEHLLARRSALAIFPTGGGKSLCYQLPALTFDGVTVVISPLIALMKDQIDFLKSRGVSAERLDSTLTAEETRSVMSALLTVRGIASSVRGTRAISQRALYASNYAYEGINVCC